MKITKFGVMHEQILGGAIKVDNFHVDLEGMAKEGLTDEYFTEAVLSYLHKYVDGGGTFKVGDIM